MSDTICLEIPREIFHSTRMSPDEMKRELAVSLFQQARLSFGKAREMAGMTTWSFQQLLADRQIAIHYDVEEYEADLETLKRLGRL